MPSQIKKISKQRERDIVQDKVRIYIEFLGLVEQPIHVRIVTDEIWRYRWERFASLGVDNSVIIFSQVALENFAVQQLWKLFDSKNSVFHIWYVAKNLQNPALTKWLDNNIKKIQKDITLIGEWRHVAVSHRGKAGYFAPNEHQKKFTTARLSEKRMCDFLLEFLCQIKFEIQGTPLRETMEELQLGLQRFKSNVKNEMVKVFKDL